MKKILYSLVLGSFLLIAGQSAKAKQPGITNLFCEDFDGPVTQWRTTSGSFGVLNQVPWFRVTDVTKSGSPGAAADTISPRNN